MPINDLPVISRGSFFEDSFFNETWADFDRAMQRVVGRFDRDPKMSQYDSPSQTPHGSSSRRDSHNKQLREDRVEGDLYATQAVQVTEKDGKYQAVIDVKDFNPRDLQVKVVDERIVLEGRYDVVSEDEKSSTSKAFYREFHLPPEADIDQVSTALSKDGVLTIKAPRKEGVPLPSVSPKGYPESKMDHIKNIRNFIQNSSGFESYDATDSLPKDMKDRLLLSDRDSGRWSGSGSPSCTSPTPSDAGSEASKVSSTMDFDIGKRAPFNRSEVSFKVKAPDMASDASTASSTYGSRVGTPQSSHLGSSAGMPLGSTSSISSLGSSSTIHEDAFRNTPTPSQTPQPSQAWPHISNQQQNMVPSFQPHNRPAMARSSGGTATISVKEKDGKRIQTSETTSVVQEKDGFLESKEVASEVTGKEAQGARREANTRMMKEEHDPMGRGKKSEAADASDVSESTVERRPDGSVVTTKKSSTSSTNFKQSFSTDPGAMPPSIFESDFGDIRSLMGRGHSLMSQMSGDSPFPEMGNMSSRMNSAFPSRLSEMSHFEDFPEMQSPFGDRFADRSMFPRHSDFPSRTGFSSNFPSNFSSSFNNESSSQQESTNPRGTSNTNTKNYTKSSSQSSFSNSIFDNRKF